MRPLLVETVRVTWRIEADDLRYLNRRFGGRVNTVVRQALHDLVVREREREAAGRS